MLPLTFIQLHYPDESETLYGGVLLLFSQRLDHICGLDDLWCGPPVPGQLDARGVRAALRPCISVPGMSWYDEQPLCSVVKCENAINLRHRERRDGVAAGEG